MVTRKLEVRYISGLDGVIREIPVATPTFSTTPDSIVILSTLSDVGQQPETKMATYNRKYALSHYLDVREIFTVIH